MNWFTSLFSSAAAEPINAIGNVPLDSMMELTLAMLGLATLRTVEKLNGASK